MEMIRADAKGRITIPKHIRREMGIGPGDTLAVSYDSERRILFYAKPENPFDTLADDALAQYRAGKTRSLREIARDYDE